jgi:hypothetical protein
MAAVTDVAASVSAERVSLSPEALRLATQDRPGPNAHTSAPVVMGSGPDADQRFEERTGASRLGGGPTIDPRLPTIARLLEETFGGPVLIRQTRQGPPAELALDESGAVKMELDTLDQNGLPNPGAFQARAIVQMEDGKAKSLQVVTELQGQHVTSQTYDLIEEPNRIPESLWRLAEAFAANNGNGVVLELVDWGSSG